MKQQYPELKMDLSNLWLTVMPLWAWIVLFLVLLLVVALACWAHHSSAIRPPTGGLEPTDFSELPRAAPLRSHRPTPSKPKSARRISNTQQDGFQVQRFRGDDQP